MTDDIDQVKRRLLCAAGGLGAGLIVAGMCPLVSSMQPPLSAQLAGEPVTVDLSAISREQLVSVAWRGQPVWLLYRTAEMLARVHEAVPWLADPDSTRVGSVTPIYCRNPVRSRRPEWLVLIGICTHLGCIPMEAYNNGVSETLPATFPGGFVCPCHGSQYDLAGRVFKDMPAPDNLHIPPHYYLDEHTLVIGEEADA